MVAPNGYEPVPNSQRSVQICSPNGSKPHNIVKKAKAYSRTDMQTPYVCGIGYEVRSVASVDCVEERFFADLSIFMKWYDEANVNLKPGEIEADKLENKPHIILANSVSVKVRFQTYVRLANDPPGVVHSETVYTGTFREFMELEDFPLDIQDLTVSVRFVDERWAMRLLTDPRYCKITDGVELAEWLMYKPHVKTGRLSTGAATFELKMKVFRKFDYYMSNVIFMMGGITTLVFFSFLFEPSMWEQKSTYGATLLLTSVAFKFVVDGTLPKVAFTTILDIYMLAAFGVMVGVLVQGAFMKALQRFGSLSPQQLDTLDLGFGGTLAFLWIVWNAGYLCRFKHFEKQQKEILGDPLPNILTNKASPGSCRSFFCCHRGDSDDEKNSDDDSDEEWPQEETSKDLLSYCTGLEKEAPHTIVLAPDRAGPGVASGWVRDQRGLLRPEMTAEVSNGPRYPAVAAAEMPNGPSRYPAVSSPYR